MQRTPGKPPYLRLSIFYFFYFAALGAFVPYWTVYLHNHLHFTAAEIGELMAIFMVSKLIAPFLWGWLADHGGNRLQLIRLASFMTLVCFLGVYVQQGFWWLALVMGAVGFSGIHIYRSLKH